MTKAQKKKVSSWKIAATYIGTVVGAGFASGQEVLQYFGFFGIWGIVGLGIAGYMFYYFGKNLLVLGKELKAESHVPIIYYAAGDKLGRILDYVITFFLFGALTTMAAGAGAIFQQQFGLSTFWGNIVMVVITLLTVLTGISGVITAISFVVPALILAVLGISLFVVFQQGIMLSALNVSGVPAVPFWPLSAIVYVSYNLVMAVAVLGPLGNQANDHLAIRKGALWGSIGLGISATAILLAIYATLPRSAAFAVPMIYVAGAFSPFIQQAYAVVLFAEIYTTAVGSLFGFVMRLAPAGNKKYRPHIAIAACIAALFASRIGFTGLVRTLFSGVGYAGLLLLGSLIYRRLREHKISLVPQFAYRDRKADGKSVADNKTTNFDKIEKKEGKK